MDEIDEVLSRAGRCAVLVGSGPGATAVAAPGRAQVFGARDPLSLMLYGPAVVTATAALACAGIPAPLPGGTRLPD